MVAGDGTATDGTYQQTNELSGLHTAAGDRDLRGSLHGRLPGGTSTTVKPVGMSALSPTHS